MSAALEPPLAGLFLGVDHAELHAASTQTLQAANAVAINSDWVFGRQTSYCDENLIYANGPGDLGARVFMAFMWALSVLAVVLMPAQRDASDASASDGRVWPGMSASPDDSSSATVVARPSARWVMLDAVRIVAVAGVVTEHCGGTTYSIHNTTFVTMLVLPWLFIVSGIAFMMSRSSAPGYFGRLAAIFAIGVGFNILGDSIARPEWWRDIGDTVYQMAYVAALIIFALIAWPLRALLRDEAPAWLHGRLPFLVLALYGVAWLACAAVYLSGVQIAPSLGASHWGRHVAPIFANAPYIGAHVSGLLTLVALHAALGRTTDGRLPWLLLPYIYVPRVLFPMAFALAPQMILLFLLGLVVQAQPLLHADALATHLRAYWVFVGTLLLLTTMPDLLGRCDLYPPLSAWERLRWDAVELGLAVLLLTKTLVAADPLRIVMPLSWWALFAYVSHVMLSRTLPTPSDAAVIEFGLLPVFVLGFYLADLWQQRRRNDGETSLLASFSKPFDGAPNPAEGGASEDGAAGRPSRSALKPSLKSRTSRDLRV